jgi:predicted Zn-dependent protease
MAKFRVQISDFGWHTQNGQLKADDAGQDTMPDGRIEILREYLEEDPDDPFLRFALATELLKAGQEERAVETFERLIRDDPEYVGTYYHLARLYHMMGRAEEARKTAENGIPIAVRLGESRSASELRQLLSDFDAEE